MKIGETGSMYSKNVVVLTPYKLQIISSDYHVIVQQ
jgi:hypothetical protein